MILHFVLMFMIIMINIKKIKTPIIVKPTFIIIIMIIIKNTIIIIILSMNIKISVI